MFPLDTKILIIDDSSLARQNIKTVLLGLDFHNIHEASDGESGIKAIFEASSERSAFGLILLDINMPGINGLEVAKRIREKKELAELPIIFITARGQQKQVEEGLASGGNRYITKPFTQGELKINLERLWSKFH